MRTFVKLKPGQGSSSATPGPREAYLLKYSDTAYYKECKIWRPARIVGLVSSLFALFVCLASVLNSHWLVAEGSSVGIWRTCYAEVIHNSTIECPDSKAYWQNAVIGLLLFSVAFGFLASVLSICGVCTGALPKKIYYYHSAGEIFLICALSCTAALVVYPVAIEVGPKLGPHSLGFGYGLGWGASVFYFAASLCMCLDDIVRTCTQGCCLCCRKDRNNSPL